jgi:DNA polymerase-3 subunit delta
MPDKPSIILLHGNDEFAIGEKIHKFCTGLGSPSASSMNISRFDGISGFTFEAFNSAVNAVPFLAPNRVVVLRHLVAACGLPETRMKLLGILEKAAPTTTIVLVEDESLKINHWLVKWVVSHGSPKEQKDQAGGNTKQEGVQASIHTYNLPKRWEMPRWIESEMKNQGGKIEPDAAARLAEMIGEDTGIAAQEITKLLIYVDFKRPVTILDVENVSIVSAQGNVFMLVDALGQGNTKEAQRLLHQLLEEEDAFRLWGMVIRQFRLLLQARELIESGENNRTIEKTLGLPDFVVPRIVNQAKRFNLSRLESIYHKLLEIDEGSKTSQVPLDLALDTLIVEMS